ncbi:MAG: DinB family protein [Chloroflexi bacterium]|nr:DinB family protein [Chloroflexota bacterium]
MANPLCLSLLTNLRSCCNLLEETIAQFDPQSWVMPGIDRFQTPVMIANHTVECLDYFFRSDTASPWDWGWPFRDKWELADQQLPSSAQVLGYLHEVRARIETAMAALTDADLALPYPPGHEHGHTRLEHYVYAIRHTMHHHGALSLLALQAGCPQGHWE